MKRMMWTIALLVVGCATLRNQWQDEVHTRAAFDLQCPQDQITVVVISKGTMTSGPIFGAQGCGRRATYLADTRHGVQMNSPVSQDAPPAGAEPVVEGDSAQ